MRDAFPAASVIHCGDFRRPRQMLGRQTYGGHKSIHDDGMAELGLPGGPIEGPNISANSTLCFIRCLGRLGSKPAASALTHQNIW